MHQHPMYRIVTLAAGGAVAIAGTLVANCLLASAPAYGQAETPKLQWDAETVHIKGWMLLDPGDEKLEKFPFERWFDKRNGRFKDSHPMHWFGDYTSGPQYHLVVSDGEYVMDAYHRRNSGRAELTKISPFVRRLRARTMEPFRAFMESPDQMKSLRRIASESYRGKAADVWEGEIAALGRTVPHVKLRIWVSPSSGEMLRCIRWRNADVQGDSVRWLTDLDADTIEYNVLPPADCFQTDPPEGCTLTNTKETAFTRELGDFDGKCRFYTCLGFVLNDGSALVGWHANHKQQESQADYFADLKIGGPLPELPARIVALKPWPMQEDLTCVGRHLAWTQKKGRFYEWGIYVPDRRAPERSAFEHYRVVNEFRGVEPRGFGGRPNFIGEELTITSESEFDTWVRDAMAELSDTGEVPEHVTYRDIADLAQRIRVSLGE